MLLLHMNLAAQQTTVVLSAKDEPDIHYPYRCYRLLSKEGLETEVESMLWSTADTTKWTIVAEFDIKDSADHLAFRKREIWRRVESLRPKSGTPRRNLSDPTSTSVWQLLDTADPEAAKKFVDAELRKDQQHPDLHLALADIYAWRMNADTSSKEKVRWFNKAEREYRTCLDLNKNSPEANFNLAILYIERARLEFNELNDENVIERWFEITKRTDKTHNQARPYLEHSYLMDSTDQTTIDTLNRLYASWGQDAYGKSFTVETQKRYMRK